MFFYGAAYQKSQSAVFVLPEKGVPSAVVRTVRSSFSLAEMLHLTLQCFDTVGWAAGRASGL